GQNNITQVWAMNDSGTMVGTSQPGYSPGLAFGWSEEEGVFDLLRSTGYVYGEWGGSGAYGLNNEGAAVGSFTEGAFLVMQGSLTLLQSLSPGHGSVAASINDAGTVAGLSFLPDEEGGDMWVVVWHRDPGGTYGAPVAL